MAAGSSSTNNLASGDVRISSVEPTAKLEVVRPSHHGHGRVNEPAAESEIGSRLLEPGLTSNPGYAINPFIENPNRDCRYKRTDPISGAITLPLMSPPHDRRQHITEEISSVFAESFVNMDSLIAQLDVGIHELKLNSQAKPEMVATNTNPDEVAYPVAANTNPDGVAYPVAAKITPYEFNPVAAKAYPGIGRLCMIFDQDVKRAVGEAAYDGTAFLIACSCCLLTAAHNVMVNGQKSDNGIFYVRNVGSNVRTVCTRLKCTQVMRLILKMILDSTWHFVGLKILMVL